MLGKTVTRVTRADLEMWPYLVSTGGCSERNAEIHAIRVKRAAQASSV
jgi:hypothetical protein